MAEDRELTITTPLGPDELYFSDLSGFDEISRPFRFDLTLASENIDIVVDDLLGKDMTVKIGIGAGVRFLHGIVEQFRFGDIRDRYVRYHAVLRPALWYLSKTRDNRIFQNMSVVDIIEDVLGEYPDVTFEKRLEGTYEPRDYCVQYGESNLDFVQRLMEHEGIWYFHEYADGSHTLVLTDAVSKMKPFPGFEEVEYRHDPNVAVRHGKFLTYWSRRAEVRTGKYTHTDYDFEKPSADLMAQTALTLGHPQGDSEDYHYPGTYIELARGDDLAAVRAEENQSPWQRVEARGTVQGLSSGVTFKLVDFPREIENDEYAVLRTDYDLTDEKYSGETRTFGSAYRIRVLLTPTSVSFRPQRLTPKPRMMGPQTAVVCGPSGEEIYTDEYARVKVQFHWDRKGEKDENTSCWVRVSSVWAGSGWGFIQIPRIGQEVIVDFLEGDPDQPIITGRVYNAEQMPPYGLPGNATQSGWKSNSSLGGGGWNEIRFEDKKGDEEVYFQAEKNHVELVKNDETRTIGHDWIEDVGNDATQSVGHNRDETVGNDKTTGVGNNRTVNIGVNDDETVGSNRSLAVGSNESISVGSNSDETIGVNHSQSVGAAQSLSVGATRTRTVGAAESVTVGAAQSIAVGGAQAVTVGAGQALTIAAENTVSVGADQSVSVGASQSVSVASSQSTNVGEDQSVSVGKNQSTSVGEDASMSVGKNLAVDAGDSILLKCGSASISMKKDGTIVIDGKDITVKGSGKINVNASSDVTIKGSKINQN